MWGTRFVPISTRCNMRWSERHPVASVEARPNGTYRVRWREGGQAQRLTCDNRPYADAAAAWIEQAKGAGEVIVDTDERLKVKVWLLRQGELPAALATVGATLNDVCQAYDRSHRG